ncbi:MAG TPA: aminotransferase class I/II-fold pyridoxal phosphate-dependent enzyme [Methylomirabilota bacterium]|nr:aminotransferase class I/II-fold pyridoxal phosphate-dependent enzyme [Methylomirabilota bacterium]
MSPGPAERAVGAVHARLVSLVAEALGVAPETISIKRPLRDYGFDSLAAVTLTADLEDWLGRPVDPALLMDYPTIEALAGFLACETSGPSAPDEVPPEHNHFELFPEYLALRDRFDRLQNLGLANPFFRVHEGIARDTVVIGGRRLINFSSYNYLGMSGDPVVCRAAKAAIDAYGTSVSASRIVAGERPLHRELERELATLLGTEDCVVHVSGHATNVATIGYLLRPRPRDLILYDAQSHNSLVQGGLVSRAARRAFPHNDWEALDSLLSSLRGRHERVLVALEGAYSMEGDVPDLPNFIAVVKRRRAFLIVDEAHSMGVLGAHGRGVGEHFKVDPNDVDLWMGTLSKAFASCGGYIAGRHAVVEHLKYLAPGFLFSVGMSPPDAGAALAAIRLMRAEPERVARLHANIRLFRELARAHGLDTGSSGESAVVPVMVGDDLRCIALSEALFRRGISVMPVIPPAVHDHRARLRFFVTSTHSDEQIRVTVATVAQELSCLGRS